MDLTESAEEAAFRQDARVWLEANVPTGERLSGDTAEGFARSKAWEKQLFQAGWGAVCWPEKYGGRDASIVKWLIFEEEYHRAGGPPRVSQNGVAMLAPALFEFGTEEQKGRILPRIAAALDVWAQGWSEPNAGSDLWAIASSARRDSDRAGFRLTGQKAWCSRAAFCNAMFGLFRTDRDAPRPRGLTYFLVPLDAPGVTVRPVPRLDSAPGFADVFLDDVFVPDRDVLGDVNDGWRVAMATASFERGLGLRSPGRFLASAARLVDLYRRSHQSRQSRQALDLSLRGDVVQSWIEAQAYRLYAFQTATRLDNGGHVGAESSLNKLFWSELDIRLHETALRVLGPLAEFTDEVSDQPELGGWMGGFQFSLAGTIYAGTSEIQRNVVAERLLGLPRR